MRPHARTACGHTPPRKAHVTPQPPRPHHLTARLALRPSATRAPALTGTPSTPNIQLPRLKPSILDEYAKDRGLKAALGAAGFCSDDDCVALEDDGARMVLKAPAKAEAGEAQGGGAGPSGAEGDDGPLDAQALVTGARRASTSHNRSARVDTEPCPGARGGFASFSARVAQRAHVLFVLAPRPGGGGARRARAQRRLHRHRALPARRAAAPARARAIASRHGRLAAGVGAVAAAAQRHVPGPNERAGAGQLQSRRAEGAARTRTQLSHTPALHTCTPIVVRAMPCRAVHTHTVPCRPRFQPAQAQLAVEFLCGNLGGPAEQQLASRVRGPVLPKEVPHAPVILRKQGSRPGRANAFLALLPCLPQVVRVVVAGARTGQVDAVAAQGPGSSRAAQAASLQPVRWAVGAPGHSTHSLPRPGWWWRWGRLGAPVGLGRRREQAVHRGRTTAGGGREARVCHGLCACEHVHRCVCACACRQVRDLDALLAELSSGLPVDLMPGPDDPANIALPQQPLHT
jgi:hypothetical protein